VNAIELENRLNRLLSESADSVLDREQHTLERMIGSLDGEFILFGAGNLGRKVVRILARIGKTPAAFIDNNPSLWGKDVEGIPIMSPAESATKFDPQKVGVITTIWFGEATDRMADRIGPLMQLGFRKIALFGHLAWKFPAGLLPHYSLDRPSKLLDRAPDILTAFRLFDDDESREIFVNHVEWRLFLDYDVLPSPSSEEIYFNSKFVTRLDAEVLYDIGAFTGDSTKSFLATERGITFSQIHCFEPSPNNFAQLEQFVASSGHGKDKIVAHKLALGDTVGEILVETEFGPSSRVGRGNETVPVTTIDEIGTTIASPTFIKIDVEGFEPQCLRGARQTISRTAPAIAVSVYHIQSHLWDILLQLHQYNSAYSFRLCPHVADGWDLVLYAVPKNRVPV
jgi:FkbM family methyltransferase